MIIDEGLLKTSTKGKNKGILTDSNGEPANESLYKPSEPVKTITAHVLKRFSLMEATKNKPYRELNNMSVLERQSVDQVRFNSYQFYQSGDPNDDWKSNAVRPITRNQTISIAAHITASIMYPNVFAQNENNEDDKDSALVMRELMEWSTENSNPVWERTFVFAVIAALVNPAAFIHTEYAENYRTVKVENEDYEKPVDEVSAEEGGEAKEPVQQYKEQTILDEEYSGFCDTIVPIDEIWMPDYYQYDVQRQPDFIWRKVITYEEAQEKYGSHDNFQYVHPGIQTIFVDSKDLFYESYDQNLRGTLVEELIYWNRNKDLKLCFVNGVIMCDPNCPNPRKDKKLPLVKMGYEIVDEGKFAFHKSLVNKLGPDEEVVQTLYRMVIDGTYLQLFPPSVIFGDEAVDSSIIAPGMVTTLSEGTKFQALNPGNNLQAGMAMLEKVESSMIETGVKSLSSGQRMTAQQVQAIEQEINTMLGLFNRMIGFAIRDFYSLRIGDILQYMTVGNVMDISSPESTLKFQTFLMHDRIIEGKKKNRRINFKSDPLNTDKPTKQDKLDYEFKMLAKVDNDTELIEVDPLLFSKRKFKLKVTPDIIAPPSDNVKKALNLEEYDRAIQNPLSNQEAIFRDLLLGSYDTTKSDPDKYIQKQPQQQGGLGSMIGANGTSQPAPQAPGNSATAMMSNQRQQESAAELLTK